jgi:phage tail sheath protein FI
MALAKTFPGVFIEEVPSGVRTITGVPTAVAAFVGRTKFGPTDTPIIVNNFGEFEKKFGGLDASSSTSYAVRDFFGNGGGQAVVVRLYQSADQTSPPTPDVAQIRFGATSGGQLELQAASPGSWASQPALTVTLERLAAGANLNEIAAALGVNTNTIFTLRAVFGDVTEVIRNVTLAESARRYDRVLVNESTLIRATGTLRANTDATTLDLTSTVAGGRDSAALGTGNYLSDIDTKKGIQALEKTDIFNILCIPPDVRTSDGWGVTDPLVWSGALDYAVTRRAMLVVDPLPARPAQTVAQQVITETDSFLVSVNLSGTRTRNAVTYFPRVLEPDPLRGNVINAFVPCGIVAGVMARTDGQRGVWKAPAGIDAGIAGITGLELNLSDADNGVINPVGVNALRSFPIIGSVVWGARTMRGADTLADEAKYLPVRRVTLFIEESLFRGTKFAVFEPNDEPLWAQLRLNIGAFMNNLFRQGAFQGQTPRDAYFVKCDKETTTQNDINLGVVNILVGFAPLKPAEFVVITLQQIAGQTGGA